MHATVSTLFRNSRQTRAAGFTLIELAIVLFILTLMLAGFLVPLATQVDQRNISDTQKSLDDVKEALIGFAVSKGYLPCPDLTSGAGANDGLEDVSAGTCIATAEGNLPWVTLGLGASDVLGNRFRYRVTSAFAQRAPAAVFNFSTAATLRVCTDTACTATLTDANPNGAVAIILSLGKNGYGAIDALTGTARPAPTSADELQNVGGTTYVSRPITPLGAAAGEFDDIVTWLGKYTLFNRMVAAGKLP